MNQAQLKKYIQDIAKTYASEKQKRIEFEAAYHQLPPMPAICPQILGLG